MPTTAKGTTSPEISRPQDGVVREHCSPLEDIPIDTEWDRLQQMSRDYDAAQLELWEVANGGRYAE